MKKTQLINIIREIIEEKLDETGPLTRHAARSSKLGKNLTAAGMTFANLATGGALSKHAEKNPNSVVRKIAKWMDSPDSSTTSPKFKAKVTNPKTGQEILATTAYRAGPDHPAYSLAKTALKKEVASLKEKQSQRDL